MRVHFQNKRGGVLVQVVIALVVLFGFTALTTDYGLMAVRQRKLQSATDAAALAAGPEMYQRNNPRATERATEFAAANGIEPGQLTSEWSGPNTFEVTAWSDVNTPFLRVLDGRQTGRRVSALSEVVAVTPLSLNITSKLRPWGIPIGFFNPGNPSLSKIRYDEDVDLRLMEYVDEQRLDTPDGTYFIQPFALDVNRKDSASGDFPNYRHDVQYGYDKPMSVSDKWNENEWMITQPSTGFDSILNATHRAVMSDAESLVNRAKDEAFRNDSPENYNPDNPRLIFLPIYDRSNRGGNYPKAQVLGFTAFYVKEMSGDIITGRFVRHSLPYDGNTLDSVSVTQLYTGIIQFHLVK